MIVAGTVDRCMGVCGFVRLLLRWLASRRCRCTGNLRPRARGSSERRLVSQSSTRICKGLGFPATGAGCLRGHMRGAANHRCGRIARRQRSFPVRRLGRSDRLESQLSRVSQGLPGFLSEPDDERLFLQSIVDSVWDKVPETRTLRNIRIYCGWLVRIRQAASRRCPGSPCRRRASRRSHAPSTGGRPAPGAAPAGRLLIPIEADPPVLWKLRWGLLHHFGCLGMSNGRYVCAAGLRLVPRGAPP